MKDLISYYETRFAKNDVEIRECVSSAAVEVNKKLHELKNKDFSNVRLSEYQVKDYITKFKKRLCCWDRRCDRRASAVW